MKNINKQTLLFLVICIFNVNHINAQTIDTLVFSQNCESGHRLTPPTSASRNKMISSRRHGKISVDTTGVSPSDNRDIVLMSLKIAKETWENYLDDDSLSIRITIDNSISSDIVTEVPYFVDGNRSFPLSLYRRQHPESNFPQPDAEIIIKDPNNWQTGYETEGKKNLTLGFMQSIAVAMGFGSSLIQKTLKRTNEEIVTITSNKFSITDSLIATLNNIRLKGITVTSRNIRNDSLENYARGYYGNPYIMTENGNYKLYAPTVFENGTSMRLLDMPGSIMSQELPDSMESVVDNITTNVLDAIGWMLRETPTQPDFHIQGEGIDSTGITSAYQSHTYILEGCTQGITNYYWTFELPLANNGGYELVATSTGQTMVVPAITNENNYEQLHDGVIKGHVSFYGLRNGYPVYANYYVTLELKPVIVEVKFNNIVPCAYDEDFYNADVAIKYTGSHYLFANVQEEYSTLLTGYYTRTPYYTTLHLTDIDSWGTAWLHVTARNAYGSTTETYEIPYAYESREAIQGVETVIKEGKEVCVYETDGTSRGRYVSINDAMEHCKKGTLYILKITDRKGHVRNIKHIKQ